MEKNFLDDTFLARWISGDLSTEELEAFKKSSDYHKFNKINEGAQNLKTPAYNKEAAFSKLQQQLEPEKDSKKIEKRMPLWMYSSAAAILVMAFGIFYFLNLPAHYQTGFGEQLAVILPDNSKVPSSPPKIVVHMKEIIYANNFRRRIKEHFIEKDNIYRTSIRKNDPQEVTRKDRNGYMIFSRGYVSVNYEGIVIKEVEI